MFVKERKRQIVECDSSKFGSVSFSRIVETPRINTVVTDTGADAEEADAVRAVGPEVILVEPVNIYSKQIGFRSQSRFLEVPSRRNL